MKHLFTLLIAIIIVESSFAQLWTETSNFASPRNSQTLTMLNDGRVIQIGGNKGFQEFTNTVEIYENTTDTWTVVDSVPYNIESHSAFLLSNNRVIILGGTIDATSTDSVYVYNVTDNSWTPMSNMPKRLCNLSAQKLDDGRIFVTGGWTYETATINESSFIFDPELNKWTSVASIPLGMVNSACELLDNNKVFVAGGLDNNFNACDNTFIYDVETDTWEEVDSMPFTISGGMPSTKIYNGNVLTVGGFSVSTFSYYNEILIFNVAEKTWSELSSLDNDISNSMLISLPDSTVLLAGGNGGAKKGYFNPDLIVNKTATFYKGLIPSSARASYDNAYIIDIYGNSVKQIESLPRVTTGAPVVLLQNNNVLMSGGSGEAMATDTYENGVIYNNPNPFVSIIKTNDEKISIYPNPSNGLFYVSGIKGNYDAFVFNSLGKCVLKQNISSENNTIDLRNLASGSYFFKTNKSPSDYKKLIIN